MLLGAKHVVAGPLQAAELLEMDHQWGIRFTPGARAQVDVLHVALGDGGAPGAGLDDLAVGEAATNAGMLAETKLESGGSHGRLLLVGSSDCGKEVTEDRHLASGWRIEVRLRSGVM